MISAALETRLTERYSSGKILRGSRYFILFILIFALAAWQAEIDLVELAKDLPSGIEKLSEFFPPAWYALPELIQPALDTILLALVPLPLGIVLAIPVALAASHNVAPRWLRVVTRAYITFQRNLPEIILALLFVRAFGLGPFPGIVAIMLGSIGMLAKLLADAIEEVDQKVIDAVAATGASRWQVIRYAVIPEVIPSLVANGIFRFEVNMRQAGLLGAVGAGGLGLELQQSLNQLEYERVTMTFLLLLALIAMAERISDYLRKHIIARGSAHG